MKTGIEAGAASIQAPASGRVSWRVVLGIFKLRIGVLITLTALAGMAIVPPSGQQSGLDGWQMLVLTLSVLVSSASAGAFNQFFEAESDRLMQRTRGRAFAKGTLPRNGLWLGVIVAMLVLAVGAAAWWVNIVAAAYVLAGALTYALVYTVGLKRRTSWNIVIGGLAGSFAVLAGAAAVNPQVGPLGWLLALVLFLWTPPHFWSLAIAHKAQYAAAGVPMLPVVIGEERAARVVHFNTWLLVLASLLPLAFGAGWCYALGAVLGGLYFLRKSRALLREPVRERAMASFFASMAQLSFLLMGVWLDAALR